MSKSHSNGTKLFITTGTTTTTDVAVGGIKSIGGLELSRDTVDVTALDNPDGYREFLGGFKDGGEVPVSGYLDGADAGQAAIHAAFESGAVTPFEVRFPGAIGKSWTFNGVVTKFATGADVDGAITFDTTIKVSGKPDLGTTPTSGGGAAG